MTECVYTGNDFLPGPPNSIKFYKDTMNTEAAMLCNV